MKLHNEKNNAPWWHLWKCPCKQNGRGEETRQKLLQSAFDEIHRVGFQAASLSKILKDTHITKGALYHHFDNKMELGYAVMDEIIVSFFQQVWVEPLRRSDDPITTIQNIILQSGIEMTEEDAKLGCPLNNLAQEMSPIDEGFKRRTTGIYDEWRAVIEEALKRGKAAKNIREDADPRQLAILLVATLEGCMGLAKGNQSLELLLECGQGLCMHMERVRPDGARTNPRLELLKNPVPEI